MSVKRTALALGTLTAALCAPLVAAGPAQASGGGTVVRAAGHCTGAGSWDVKAKHDDGRIEIEFEVDTNRAGQTWAVRITDNRALVLSRTARTTAPSGSFSVAARPRNRAGADVIRVRATRGANVCAGSIRV